MLFEESELNELDKLAVKNEIKKEALAKKPALKIKHWISVNAIGMLSIIKKYNPEKHKGELVFLETESMEIAQEILNAVPKAKGTSLYSKGNYYVPEWDSTSAFGGISALNLSRCDRWLSNIISILGYEKRNTYKILHEPRELAKKLREKSRLHQQAEQCNRHVEQALALMAQLHSNKIQEEEKMLQDQITAMAERNKNIQEETLAIKQYKAQRQMD